MGRRSGNVEADLVLLLREAGNHRLAVVEVKDGANNAWYAAVENLLQMRLLSANPEQRRLFHVRLPGATLDENLPVMGLVAAPPAYYSSKGRKALAVEPARRLQDRFRTEVGVDVHLATWDTVARRLTKHHS